MSNSATVVTNEYQLVRDSIVLTQGTLPAWVHNDINRVVENYTKYLLDSLVNNNDNLLNAVNAIEVAKNDYMSFLGAFISANSALNVRFDNLNSTLADSLANISNLYITKADADSAIAARISTIRASLLDDISSTVSTISAAYSSELAAITQSITVLTTSWEDQYGLLQGLAESTLELSNYTGYSPLDTTRTLAQSLFEYNNVLKLGDKYYTSGFGLVSQLTGNTTGTIIDPGYSEFWVKADRFKLTSADDESYSPFQVIGSDIVFNGKVQIANVENAPLRLSGSELPADNLDHNAYPDGSTYFLETPEGSVLYTYVVNKGWISSEGRTGLVVKLVTDKLGIAYDEAGNVFEEFKEVGFYAETYGGDVLATYTYRLYKDGVLVVEGLSDAVASYVYEVPEKFTPVVGLFKVEVLLEDVVVAVDEITLLAAKEGSSVVNLVLSNELHSVYSESNGTVPSNALPGSGTLVQVFRGIEPLTYGEGNNQFTGSVTLASGSLNGLSVGNALPVTAINGSIFRVEDYTSMGSNSATVKIEVIVKDISGEKTTKIVKYQTITVSKKGDSGTAGSPGSRGSSFLSGTAVASSAMVNEYLTTLGSVSVGDQYLSSTSTNGSSIYTYNGSSFVNSTSLRVSGDAVIDGTLAVKKLQSLGDLSVPNFSAAGNIGAYSGGLLGWDPSTSGLRAGVVGGGNLYGVAGLGFSTGGVGGIFSYAGAGYINTVVLGSPSHAIYTSGNCSLGNTNVTSLTVNGSPVSSYTLPTASTSVKGGVIVGDGLEMIGDTLRISSSVLKETDNIGVVFTPFAEGSTPVSGTLKILYAT